MGKRRNRKKHHREVDCAGCIYLTTCHTDLVNKTSDCVLLRENIKGKKIKNKHRRKLKKAITRFRLTGKTKFCRFFSPFVSWRTFGKKGTDFIKGRYDEPSS